MNISVELNGQSEVIASLDSVADGIRDLRKGAWVRVRQAFNRIEKGQFGSEGSAGASGAWAPLTPAYAKVKQAKFGSKPINQRTGRLFKSLTQAGGDAVVEEKADELTLGTRVPYSGYVNAKRPIISMTPENVKELTQPIELYLRQLADNARLGSLR